jgi:hypothetical protein
MIFNPTRVWGRVALQISRSVAAGCLWVAAALGFAISDAQGRSEAISRAVQECLSQWPSPKGQAGRLSDDGSVLCFDGPIDLDLDLTPLSGLQRDGFFVVRSPGGYNEKAMTMADMLAEKNATVVIRDCCWSACANYLLIASNQTYVLANAIVAWHGGHANCGNPEVAGAIRRLYVPCYSSDQSRDFFAKRGIDSRHIVMPQTRYSKQMLYAAMPSATDKRSLLWMWHPKNHRDYFKDRIVYESYPDEDFVYAFMRQWRERVRFIYDPEQ